MLSVKISCFVKWSKIDVSGIFHIGWKICECKASAWIMPLSYLAALTATPLRIIRSQRCRNPEGMGDIYPNSLSMVYICILPIIWLWCAAERRSPFEFGRKKCSIVGEDLFFGLHLSLGKKVFFWSWLNLLTYAKSWSRFIPPMLKIGQNWGKFANYPPNAQQTSAPLFAVQSQRCLRRVSVDSP